MMSTQIPVRQARSTSDALARFSLVGGPLNVLAVAVASRIGRGDHVLVGAGFSLALWAILALLAALAGYAEQFFSLQALALHARMLVAIPLILACAGFLDRTVRDACAELVRSGIVAGEAKVALDRDAALLARLATSWWSQLGLLLAVVAFGVLVPVSYLPGVALLDEAAAPASISAAGLWYWLVCLPVFRFVMARFLWLLGLWVFLLWRVSRQPLNLTATHPDRAGGLGLLAVAQAQLVSFVIALAVIDASALAASFRNTGLDTQQIYVHAALIAAIGVVLVVGPLLPFMSRLFECRLRGMVAFSALAREYAARFDRRWTDPASPDYADLLGSADIQSLADLGNGFSNVRATRVLPVDTTLLLTIFFCAVLPYAPLMLLEYPVSELIATMFEALLGL